VTSITGGTSVNGVYAPPSDLLIHFVAGNSADSSVTHQAHTPKATQQCAPVLVNVRHRLSTPDLRRSNFVRSIDPGALQTRRSPMASVSVPTKQDFDYLPPRWLASSAPRSLPLRLAEHLQDGGPHRHTTWRLRGLHSETTLSSLCKLAMVLVTPDRRNYLGGTIDTCDSRIGSYWPGNANAPPTR